MSRALSLAGFQVTFIGRFWVTPEARRENPCEGDVFFAGQATCQPMPLANAVGTELGLLWSKRSDQFANHSSQRQTSVLRGDLRRECPADGPSGWKGEQQLANRLILGFSVLPVSLESCFNPRAKCVVIALA